MWTQLLIQVRKSILAWPISVVLNPYNMPSYPSYHDDVIKWKHFPRYWTFVRGIHRSPVNSPHKGRWHGALMFSLICVRGWGMGWCIRRNTRSVLLVISGHVRAVSDNERFRYILQLFLSLAETVLIQPEIIYSKWVLILRFEILRDDDIGRISWYYWLSRQTEHNSDIRIRNHDYSIFGYGTFKLEDTSIFTLKYWYSVALKSLKKVFSWCTYKRMVSLTHRQTFVARVFSCEQAA